MKTKTGFKFNGVRDEMTIRFTHYLEYQVLMFTGAYSWYRMFFIIFKDFSWNNLILWSWACLMQFFYMQRSYERLEIERRHKESKLYQWIFYTIFAGFLIYCFYKGIKVEDFLEEQSK